MSDLYEKLKQDAFNWRKLKDAQQRDFPLPSGAERNPVEHRFATAAEVLADLGPVLDAWCEEVWGPDWRTSMPAGGCGMSDVYRDRLRAAWATARAKLVTT